MDIFEEAAGKIIQEQEGIVGPVALEQAQKVSGLSVDWLKKEIKFSGNATDILEKLVEQYKGLFGQASVEVCRDAVKNIRSKFPANQIPQLLQ